MNNIRFHASKMFDVPAVSLSAFSNKCVNYHQRLGTCIEGTEIVRTQTVLSDSVYAPKECDRVYHPTCTKDNSPAGSGCPQEDYCQTLDSTALAQCRDDYTYLRVQRPLGQNPDGSTTPASTPLVSEGKSLKNVFMQPVEGELTQIMMQSQLQCLCEHDETEYLRCFSNGYPQTSCLEDGDPACLDWSISTDLHITASRPVEIRGGLRDTFDDLPRSHLEYVHETLKRETSNQNSGGFSSLTRCPYGTMTQTDGAFQLELCVARKSVTFLRDIDTFDIVVVKLDPIDLALSTGPMYQDVEDE
eukprot:GSA25T00005818001.1